LIEIFELNFIKLTALIKCMFVSLGDKFSDTDKKRHRLEDATSKSDKAETDLRQDQLQGF
jgi:hypothetical protein